MTTTKDSTAFLYSIRSALVHLKDVRDFYIVTPNVRGLKEEIRKLQKEDLIDQVDVADNPRVVFVDESIFPFNFTFVSDVILAVVQVIGKYNISGDSPTPLHSALRHKGGWYLQQLLKMYAGTNSALT